MFGFRRKRAVKSVEEFLKSQETGSPSVETSTASMETGVVRLRPFITPVIEVLVVLALLFAAFAKISSLESDVNQLRSQLGGGDVQALKARVAALDGKVEKSGRETAQLTNDVARLEKEIETAKTPATKARASAKRPAVKKKPVKRRT